MTLLLRIRRQPLLVLLLPLLLLSIHQLPPPPVRWGYVYWVGAGCPKNADLYAKLSPLRDGGTVNGPSAIGYIIYKAVLIATMPQWHCSADHSELYNFLMFPVVLQGSFNHIMYCFQPNVQFYMFRCHIPSRT